MSFEKRKEEKSTDNNHNIKVAVITGNHPFDVIAFHEMLKSLSGIDFYIQDLENLIVDTEKVFTNYDVYLFYNFHMSTPEATLKIC